MYLRLMARGVDVRVHQVVEAGLACHLLLEKPLHWVHGSIELQPWKQTAGSSRTRPAG
jgi:hypothetical protein